MWKTNGLCVMLGTEWTWTARTLDVFLELIPRSTPPAALSWLSESSILHFMRGLIFLFFFFGIPFSRPLLKDKPRLRKDRMTDFSLFVSVHITQNNTSTVWKKRWTKKRMRGLLSEKSGRASVGLMASFKDFSFYSQHFCLHVRGRDCWDADLDVHARCFLSASYCLSQFSFPWCRPVQRW